MKIVLALEGIDGAGKSSLARALQKRCEQLELPCTRIGRRSGSITPVVLKLTNLMAEEARQLTPLAEVYLRVARESVRAHLAAGAPSGVVILDRFVLSVLALARLNGHDVELLTCQLKEIVSRADLHATIFVRCPFESAWERVQGRKPRMVLPPGNNKSLLRRMAEFVEEDFYRGMLTGQQWTVDNSKSMEEAEEQLAEYLIPYVQFA
jgi:thymidylate kinase